MYEFGEKLKLNGKNIEGSLGNALSYVYKNNVGGDGLTGQVTSTIIDIKRDHTLVPQNPYSMSTRCIFLKGGWVLDLTYYDSWVDKNLKVGSVLTFDVFMVTTASFLNNHSLIRAFPSWLDGYNHTVFTYDKSGNKMENALPDKGSNLDKFNKKVKNEGKKKKIGTIFDNIAEFVGQISDLLG